MKNNTVPAASVALSTYEQSALDFLAKHGIAFRAVLAKTQKNPGWDDGDKEHGLHYRVTLSSDKGLSTLSPNLPRRISFDFWNSVAAKEKGETPTAYGVLACISGDVHCPNTFADFCGEYGYDEDSRAALATFKRCAAFAKRLRGFFTKKEIEGLSEIQ